MSEQMFDIDDLMDSQVEGASSTQMITVPEGEWNAYISKHEGRQVNTGKGPRAVVDVTWTITDQEVIDATHRDEPTVRQTLWLDLNEVGQLDMSPGMNTDLGRLREALGQNGPGQWSFSQLEGGNGVVRVEHNPDRNNPEIIYANVRGVAAA